MIILLRGTSCSGKDTFAYKHFPAHTILSSDNFRLMLNDSANKQNSNIEVFEMLHKTLEYRLQNGCTFTIINATNLRFKDCQVYFDMAKKYNVKIMVVSIDPPSLETLIERNKNRSVNPLSANCSVEVLEKHYNSYWTAMPRFIEEAKKNPLCTFARCDQDYVPVYEGEN